MSKLKEIFTKVYNENKWNSAESKSGNGSSLKNTQHLREFLPELIDLYNIKSILDIPCGDMNWFSKIDIKNIKYYGYDIVEELIQENREKFKNNPTIQ